VLLCSIDTHDGTWTAGHTGVGADPDSFLEYLLKGVYCSTTTRSYKPTLSPPTLLLEHMLLGRADVHLEVSTSEVRFDEFCTHVARRRIQCRHLHLQGRRQPRPPIISALASFWPGLEVLAGEVWAAREHLRPLLSLTAKHGAAPELYDIVQKVRHALVYTLSGVLHRAACYVNFVLAMSGPNTLWTGLSTAAGAVGVNLPRVFCH